MFGVSFLSPLFLIGALAAAVPILLHLFHRKTEVVIDFPAVRLLTRVPVQPASPPQRSSTVQFSWSLQVAPTSGW